jgi:GTP-binding protein
MHVDKAELVGMGTSEDHFPKNGLREIILSGRSNVGKSSFINSMTNRKNLAYTSGQPGKTQTLNFYNIDDKCHFVDVPGYGYARVSRKQREEFGVMIENYFRTRQELVLAVLLVDFRHLPTEDDIIMYDFLKHFNIPTLVIATKVDKVGTSHHYKQERLIKQKLNFEPTDYFVKYSSETNLGRDEAWKIINYFLRINQEESHE